MSNNCSLMNVSNIGILSILFATDCTFVKEKKIGFSNHLLKLQASVGHEIHNGPTVLLHTFSRSHCSVLSSLSRYENSPWIYSANLDVSARQSSSQDTYISLSCPILSSPHLVYHTDVRAAGTILIQQPSGANFCISAHHHRDQRQKIYHRIERICPQIPASNQMEAKKINFATMYSYEDDEVITFLRI